MIHKLAVVSYLIVLATCTVLHQPVTLLLNVDSQNQHTPHYDFAYEVNDAHTGDIKSQQEARRGDTVVGQYSLVQPDGVTRTVEYRANDHTGFQATVNNNPKEETSSETPQEINLEADNHPWPSSAPTLTEVTLLSTAEPAALSRSSLVQSFLIARNPWL